MKTWGKGLARSQRVQIYACDIPTSYRVAPVLFPLCSHGNSTVYQTIAMAPKENQIVVGTQRGETTIDVQKLLDKPWYVQLSTRAFLEMVSQWN
jgi:hypothetical protein